jgi:hypothetical protein
MAAWILSSIAVVSALACVAALGMWLVAEQQNARLRRLMTPRRNDDARTLD